MHLLNEAEFPFGKQKGMYNSKTEFRSQNSGVRMNSPAKSFQDLIVWKKAHEMVLDVYRQSTDFPKSEIYGLTSQLRRSAISVPANIAEGFKKKGKADKLKFLNIAQGSLEETRYFLILAADLKYRDTSSLLIQIEEVSKLLESYSNKIASSIK